MFLLLRSDVVDPYFIYLFIVFIVFIILFIIACEARLLLYMLLRKYLFC